MILTSTLTPQDVQNIVNLVSVDEYDGNLACGPYAMMFGTPRVIRVMKDGRIRLSFCLRTHNCRLKGSRFTHSGRRSVAASWQAHYDVMEAIFKADPKAHLKTAVATYNGESEFRMLAGDTFYHNVGSIVAPLYLGEAAV
jgi:hypothetical protein